MSYFQIVVFAGILLATYVLQFWVVRRFAASEGFRPFAFSYAGGAFCAWVGMFCAVPAVAVILLLHAAYGWNFPGWLFIVGAYGSVAAILAGTHISEKRQS